MSIFEVHIFPQRQQNLKKYIFVIFNSFGQNYNKYSKIKPWCFSDNLWLFKRTFYGYTFFAHGKTLVQSNMKFMYGPKIHPLTHIFTYPILIFQTFNFFIKSRISPLYLLLSLLGSLLSPKLGYCLLFKYVGGGTRPKFFPEYIKLNVVENGVFHVGPLLK